MRGGTGREARGPERALQPSWELVRSSEPRPTFFHVGAPACEDRADLQRGNPMADGFAVHLGGGSYLDASGKIVFGAPSDVQVYEPPGGFRLDAKKLQDAFKDISGLLPKDAAAKAEWKGYGVPPEVVDFLGKVAGVANLAAKGVAIYMWAVGLLLEIVGALADKEGLSPETARVLYGLKAQMAGGEQIARADSMIKMQSEFAGRVDQVHAVLTTMNVERATGAARAAYFAELRRIVNELAVPLAQVRDQGWAATYDADSTLR